MFRNGWLRVESKTFETDSFETDNVFFIVCSDVGDLAVLQNAVVVQVFQKQFV